MKSDKMNLVVDLREKPKQSSGKTIRSRKTPTKNGGVKNLNSEGYVKDSKIENPSGKESIVEITHTQIVYPSNA